MNAEKVWIVKNEYNIQKRSYDHALSRVKRDVCDLVIVKGMEDEQRTKEWMIYHTPNRCDWKEDQLDFPCHKTNVCQICDFD